MNITKIINELREQELAECSKRAFLKSFHKRVDLWRNKMCSRLTKVLDKYCAANSTEEELKAALALAICVSVIHGDAEWFGLAEEAHRLLGYPTIDRAEIEKLIFCCKCCTKIPR
ncbi:MAG: hypothetical protein RML94_00005, partial [Bacteroidia bacterium]|nr:hypothetical protein [Bacteroidia bacterium]